MSRYNQFQALLVNQMFDMCPQYLSPIDRSLSFYCHFFQLVIVQTFTNAFRVVDMEWDQWMWCLFFGFSELIWAQIVFSIPKSVIPRKIRCCSSGISSNKEGCWNKFSRIRGISKVRRQVCLLYYPVLILYFLVLALVHQLMLHYWQ